MKKNIVALCVLYNPSKGFVEKISRWKSFVSRIYIIDNSDNNVNYSSCFSDNDCFCYHSCNGNLGIAEALNIGCRKAIEDGYKWVLTFDQDSEPEDKLISAYKSYLDNNELDEMGLLTCQIKCCSNDCPVISNTIDEIDICWTSGALMNLEAYKATSGFYSELFIDGVDLAYCLDLRKLGYKIIRLNNVNLDHQLGNSVAYRLFGWHLFYVTNHNPLRRYYMTRNSFWISEKFGKDFPEVRYGIISLIKVTMKILLFEKNKVAKIKSQIVGWMDYKKHVFGKRCHE